MLLIWLLGAGLALYTVRRQGCLYGLFILGGLLVMAGTACYGFLFWMGMAFTKISKSDSNLALPPPDLLQIVLVTVGFIGVFVSVLLILILIRSWTLPDWLTMLLPVRGLHGRRLLAAAAIVGMVGLGVWMFFPIIPYAGTAILPVFPFAGVLLVAVGSAAYFAPLWNHLATCLGAGEAADHSEDEFNGEVGTP